MLRGAAVDRSTSSQSFRERLPTSGLRNYVSCVWIQQVSPDSAPYTHRTAPNGSAELVCQLGTAPRLLGPRTGPSEEILAPGTIAVGVRLRPGAVPVIWGFPASEVVDRTLRLEDVWGGAAAALGEKLHGSRSPQEAAALLEVEIAARLTDDSALDPVAASTVRGLLPGRMNDVSALAASLGISGRQLRRRCEAAIGVPPKVLHRIFRFQGFLALARQRDDPSANLGVLAAEAGFADQAHLSRECQRLTGRSPRTALHEAKHNCDGAHDHSASDAPFVRSFGRQR